MKITKQVMKNSHQLIGKTKEEIYTLLGTPDYSEFGGAQLIYIKDRGWFRNKLAIFIDFNPDGLVESVDKLYDVEIYKE